MVGVLKATAPFVFDEWAHLAVLGGGFLRTPFVSASRDLPEGVDASCQVLDGEVIHIPAAGRKSGLNVLDPCFRRVIFTADFVKRVSIDQAVQYNQEAAGIIFSFHEFPHHNIAHVFQNAKTVLHGDPALIIDNLAQGVSLAQDTDVNDLGTPSVTAPKDRMPSGFLAFISRMWQDERHVDADIMHGARIPLHFDIAFDGGWLGDGEPASFTAKVPIWGHTGTVKVWDSRLGPNTAGVNTDGSSPVRDSDDIAGGSMRVLIDDLDMPYLEMTVTGTPDSYFPIAISDESGQVYSRNIVLKGAQPGATDIALPAGRFSTPYQVSLPLGSEIVEQNLPIGLEITSEGIRGIPLEYGANFFVRTRQKDDCEDPDISVQTIWLPVNRNPRCLREILDLEANDASTGEYYAAWFMGYNMLLHYAGTAYEFRRIRSSAQPYPFIREVPFVYGHGSRRSAVDAETTWKEEAAEIQAARVDDPWVDL